MEPDDPPIWLQSASRHGIAEEDGLHAWAFAIDVFSIDEGMVMYIGPTRSGDLIEVGIVEWHDLLAVVHAMPARPKFLR